MKQRLRNITVGMTVLILGAAGLAHAAVKDSSRVIAGPDDAAVTIEEYADFTCGYCAQGADVMSRILSDYEGKVKFIFRNLPLAFHGAAALNAAKAYSAVWLQSPSLAYMYQEELFKNQIELIKVGEPFLFTTATKLGVNIAQMRGDMNGDVVARIIADDQQLADTHGFKGTPSFMVGTESVVGAVPYEEFKKAVERQLGK